MRLWNADILNVLPQKQLTSEWRELSAISGAITKNGTPNHLLVNKVLDYPLDHLIVYSEIVMAEMKHRGMNPSVKILDKIKATPKKYFNNENICELYEGWHNERYLKQCLYNLEEKFDCNGITQEEWQKIVDKFNYILKEEKQMCKELVKVNVESRGIEELVSVYETSEGSKVVIGRELHGFLEVKSEYRNWIKNRINDCDLNEDIDFVIDGKNLPANQKREYILTLDSAKEMAMLERNEKGKQYRRYLIAVEKAFKKVAEKMGIEDMMIKQLEEQKKLKEKQIVFDNRLDGVEDKVDNQITLDHGQQRLIQREVGKRVFERIEDNRVCIYGNGAILVDKETDKKIKRKYFSSIHRDIKNRFGVPSYRDIRIKDYKLCINYIKNWVESQELREDK